MQKPKICDSIAETDWLARKQLGYLVMSGDATILKPVRHSVFGHLYSISIVGTNYLHGTNNYFHAYIIVEFLATS